MTIVVSPTTNAPTHHIKLTPVNAADGTTELGFILRPNARAISRRPRQNGQYSPFTQNDWSGGRGIKDAATDRSRFADSKRAITRHGNTVMVGGQETYSTGYRQAEAYMPGKLTWQSLLTTNRYIAYQVTASASGNRSAIYLWIRRRGTPTSTLTVELCSNSGGNPSTALQVVGVTTSTITDTISQLYEFAFSSVQAVTSTTVYWIKIYTSSADSTTNYWQVGTDAADTNNLTKASSDGSSWSAAAYDLYFRMVDDTDLLGGLFFGYKGQTYFLTRPSGSNAPKLYVNGDRGVATGTHSTTTLADTSKSWTTNEWAGSVIFIFSGTGSEFQQPYRTITSNTATVLTFPAFAKAPVSADTIYIILGSNKWTEISSHGLTVMPTGVTSTGEICYFAQGDSTQMRRMREYLSNTTWTREFAAENNYATFLGTYKHATNGLQIFKVNNSGNAGLPSFAQAKPEAWGKRLKFPYLIDNCEATTGWTFGTNVTGTVDNTSFMEGTKSIKAVKATGSSTTAPFAYRAFTQYSINAARQRAIRFWVYVNDIITAGAFTIRFSQATDCSTTILTVTVPPLPSGEWTQVTIPYADTTGGVDWMTSFGFICTQNLTFWIDGIELVPSGETLLGNKGEKITGVDVYGDPEVPWVFRTQSWGSVEDGVFNPIPVREIATAENINNGAGHTVHNVYLYVSFLHGLERFYRNNLDDVGPNRDEGLPDTRRGFITSMIGYVGRFFENYDVYDGYSAIMESASGTDHHETYRCDTAGKRIRNLFIQVVPGNTADRLWFTEGDDVAWLTLPGNTLKEDTDATFKNTHEAVLETGWITGSELDAIKLFSSVKLFLENTTSNRKIEWDYKKNDDTTWSNVSTAFSTPPVHEVTLNISARRIKLRFRLQTNDNTQTPIIRGMVVSATTRPETRYTYTARTMLEDKPINLLGQEDTATLAATTLSTLDSWMENNIILTMNSVFSPFDNKSVFLEPVVTQPISIVFDESTEKIEATLNLIEP